MRTYQPWVGLVVVAGLLLMAPPALAGGGGGGGGPCAGFAAGPTLVMRDACFDGVAHFAEAGTTLEVRNDGHAPHSLTAVDGSFDTGLLEPGETAEVQLAGAGIIRAYCTLHGSAAGTGMAGVIVVGDSPAAAVQPAMANAAGARAAPDAALLGALETQSLELAELRTDVVAVRQAVEARPTAANLAALGAPGALGTVLGGAALAVALRRRRPA